MKILLLVAALGGLLAAAVAGSLVTWFDAGEVEISFHGLLAMGLGIGVSLLLGVGLMFLVFFSSRRGYDDRANH